MSLKTPKSKQMKMNKNFQVELIQRIQRVKQFKNTLEMDQLG